MGTRGRTRRGCGCDVERIQILTLIGAELLFLLTRSQDLIVLCKSRKQRTPAEKARFDAGLGRSLVLEFLVFVPASALLVLLLSPLVLDHLAVSANRSGVYALLGVMSYGFPFSGLKQIATAMALRTLREFATIAAEPVKAELAKASREEREP